MFVSFKELSAQSRVWIYQGSRPFTPQEKEWVEKMLTGFCEQWAAHGVPLKSSFKIDKNQFLIMAVDEDFHNPSGCSIDSSVGVLRQIHETTGVDLLNRSNVPFFIDGKVELIPLQELKSAFASGRIQASTITFNIMAATKADLEKHWEIQTKSSWMTKYLSKTALTA